MPGPDGLQAVRFEGKRRAAIFLHGFSGSRDDTWNRFPGFLGTMVTDSDIFTLGYATTLLPDIVGVWSADPDLPILATRLRTDLGIAPLQGYAELVLIAHSMGGLVAQRALVDDSALFARVQTLILFGTPSGGLRKASWLRLWKRQLRNMAKEGEFIIDLRQRWKTVAPAPPGFRLVVVAGEKDQFVPPDSSLAPFDFSLHRVVPGDHLSMVKPERADAESVRVVASALSAAISADETRAPLRLAAEQPPADLPKLVERQIEHHPAPKAIPEQDIVRAALGLERAGKRPEAIALLERHQALGTDVKGVLAGRIKRLWIETEAPHYAERALELYQQALTQAQAAPEAPAKYGQIYYHAINVAFLELVAFSRRERATAMAQLALDACARAEKDVWNTATRAEANLYLGNRDAALALYREVPKQEAETWQLSSTCLQASQIASRLGDRPLLEELEAIFTPGARRVSQIFVSYSHDDKGWRERLTRMMKPYLRQAESEVTWWVDSDRIKAGDQWEVEIRRAMKAAGVAVVLVSSNFLDSDFVRTKELPYIVKAADDGRLRLLWVYVSPAAYDATELARFQATHDVKRPLALLSGPEQEQALLEIAQRIKEEALSATEKFRAQPTGI